MVGGTVQNERVGPLSLALLSPLVCSGYVRGELEFVAQAIRGPPPQLRVAGNYDSVGEVLKHRQGFFNALLTPEIYILLLMSLTSFATGFVITNSLFIQFFYGESHEHPKDVRKLYYLYAALSRVAIGGALRFSRWLREAAEIYTAIAHQLKNGVRQPDRTASPVLLRMLGIPTAVYF